VRNPDALERLPALRDSLAAHGLWANKGLGQHFLLDLNVTRKIARLAGPLTEVLTLEVGPGPGGLTRALLEAGARVLAIEKDARFLPLLADLAAAAPGRLTVVQDDALRADEPSLAQAALPGAPVRIVANLPYNVGTALLVKWLTGPLRPLSLTLMFQKEVAERIVAPTGTDAYGRLAVICGALAEAEIVMHLPARAFTPPPKVASAVVQLTPRPDRPDGSLIGALENVTREAFGQRRKMLKSSLKSLGGAELCRAAGVDAEARAETIDVPGFLRLAQAALSAAS
jgi:16S rRNA (adenine1518-N6/adenine1519-N6)-dimethyltransferase